MNNIFLRDANPDDKKFLFELVNDPDCRANSLDSHAITWEEHSDWFNKIFLSESVKVYILMKDDIRIGQGRLEETEKGYRLSYSIIPEYRGMGYGKVLVCYLEEKAVKNYSEGQSIFAEVLKSNVASQRIFEKLGFDIFAEYGGTIYYKKLIICDFENSATEKIHQTKRNINCICEGGGIALKQ